MSIEKTVSYIQILGTIKEKLRNKHNTRFRLEILASWGEFRNAKRSQE